MNFKITHIGQYFLHNGGAEIFLNSLSKLLPFKQSICTDCNLFDPDYCKNFNHKVILGGEKEIAKAIIDDDVIICWGNIKLNLMNLPMPRLCIFNVCAEVQDQINNSDKYINHFIVCSKYTAKTLNLTKKHTIIYPGIDKERLNKTINLKPKFNNKLNIGMIGRLEDQKRQHWLLNLSKKYKKYNFIFVGDGPNFEKLKSLSGDNCYFVGHIQNEIGNWWGLLDFYCLLSEKEGCSAALFEAMYTKTPIITTPVGSANDFLNNKNSIIINSEQELDLILSNIENINTKCLTEEAYKIYEKYGDINKTANSWATLIEKLLCQKRFI